MARIQGRMAIVKKGSGAAVAVPGGRSGLKTAGKKAVAKQASKQALVRNEAPKKQAAKKQAKKRVKAAGVGSVSESLERVADSSDDLSLAFHHLNRAGAVISLLEPESGGDLRSLLESGIDLYRQVIGEDQRADSSAQCASGLLRAAEHLAMAGLYASRGEYRTDVPAPTLLAVQHHLDTLDGRMDGLKTRKERRLHRLLEMARELVRRAVRSGDDPHLRYELVMAADGICSAMEAGL